LRNFIGEILFFILSSAIFIANSILPSLKNLSILKKFLFINFIFFTIIGIFLFIYLKNVQPNLIKKKSSNHIEVINNTIDNLTRLNVKFVEILKETKN